MQASATQHYSYLSSETLSVIFREAFRRFLNERVLNIPLLGHAPEELRSFVHSVTGNRPSGLIYRRVVFECRGAAVLSVKLNEGEIPDSLRVYFLEMYPL